MRIFCYLNIFQFTALGWIDWPLLKLGISTEQCVYVNNPIKEHLEYSNVFFNCVCLSYTKISMCIETHKILVLNSIEFIIC